ncbi:hypothetical protein Rhopal_007683-T1 [Rhodotorula paludigena]|uniref:D-arabinono-1,4-lactone oxidase n=1 Tax=Rhodotorula paludigena TaxID=86838 RepID=A0AAV5GXA5_9BASI|nr:hypothetical protein Rhopal_007683-T1 [Rhodotorula paludigena]
MADPLATLTHPPVPKSKLRNWSATYNCAPSLFFAPVSNQEVALVLTEAAKRGKKVRAVGLHNSPGPVWHSDEWLVSMRNFKQARFEAGKPRHAILGAGLSLREANPILASHGLSLPTVGSLPDVTVGACFCGPDHGSSAFHPIVTASAKACTIVLPSGEIRRIAVGEDLFRAAGVGLGALGIVTEVEFECDEAFGLEFTMTRIRLEDYLDDNDSGKKLFELARSEEYVKLWYYPCPTWSPSSPNTVLWRAKRTPMPPPRKEHWSVPYTAKLMHILHGLAYFTTTYLFPALQPYLNWIMFWLLASSLPKTQTLRSYEAQTMDCGYAQLVDEWCAALPAPSSPPSVTSSSKSPASPGAAILRRLVAYLNSREGRSIGMHAPVELRFSLNRGEDFYLSPGAPYGRLLGREGGRDEENDLMLWIEPIIYRPLNLPTPARFYRFTHFLEDLLRSYPASRPHWTKAHFPTPERELLRMWDAERVEAFRRVRKEQAR